MKILAVSPVPTYATWDVYDGQVEGLKANGAEVIRMNYSNIYNMFADFREFMEVTGRVNYDTVQHTLLAGDRIVMAAIIQEVDLVHFCAPMHVNPITLQVLKKYAGVKTSAYFTECPYDDDHTLPQAEYYDYCFVCDPTSLPAFREKNPNTWYVGHGYNPEKHFMNGEEEKNADVLFLGTNFPSRITFLEKVDWADIDLHLHGLMNLGNMSSLSQYVRGKTTVDNKEANRLYKTARIGLQLHRKDGYDSVKALQGKKHRKGGLVGATPLPNLVAHSLGPRSYELAASGVFQVTDAGRPELQEVFGDTVPEYTSPDDLSRLLRLYLDDPVRREDAAARQHEAVEPYTFEMRTRTILEAVS